MQHHQLRYWIWRTLSFSDAHVICFSRCCRAGFKADNNDLCFLPKELDTHCGVFTMPLLASGRLRDLGCATVFLMSCFFAEQVLTQLDLLRYRKETATYKNELYFLQNQLDEKVAITPLCVS